MKKENKYQEALNYLDWHCNVEHKEQQDLLQELADKEMPMKPIRFPHNMVRFCSICDKALISTNNWIPNYCSECGQRIDWGKDNE